MLDTVPEVLPECFENYCRKFNDKLPRQAQQENFRNYLAGLLSELHRKNIAAIASSTVNCSYVNLHHFLHDSPWKADEINDRRIDIIWQNRQTRPKVGFDLILDDSGHRKRGWETEGVERQYIGQIGKVDNGVVAVSSHVFDGLRGYPLDISQYQPPSSFEKGREDERFRTKPQLALELIDKCRERNLCPGVVLVDSGYGNGSEFLKELENRELKYVASLRKNRTVYAQLPGETSRQKHTLEEIAKNLPEDRFTKVTLPLEEPRDVWVAALPVHFPKLGGTRLFAVQLDAPRFSEAGDIDYFVTNQAAEIATAAWIAKSYSRRNWIEVFYREAKGWLGMTEYQVRDMETVRRHWILMFTAFTFIALQRFNGGFRAKWSLKPLNSWADTFRTFRHAIECQLLRWLGENIQVIAAHRAKQGLKFA